MNSKRKNAIGLGFTLIESRQRRTNSRINPVVAGFTLIELLVVIAIIALLAAVIMAGLQNARIKAENSAANQTIDSYIKAMELYRSDYDTYPVPSGVVNNTYCLGNYPVYGVVDSTPTCGNKLFGSYQIRENSGLENGFIPKYISSFPAVNTKEITVGSSFLGATYQCIAPGSGNTVCSQVKIVWYLQGDVACPFGATKSTSTNTSCTLYLPAIGS